MTRHLLYALLAIVALLTACTEPTNNTTPVVQRFSQCEITPHGQYYDSIAASVIQFDFYSDGITLDSTGHAQGSGYNLCLTDVFVSDTVLEQGVYTSSDTGDMHTMLPGHDYEGTPHGMYLLTIDKDHLVGIQVLDSGLMRVHRDSITLEAYYHTPEVRRRIYRASYVGTPVQHPL